MIWFRLLLNRRRFFGFLSGKLSIFQCPSSRPPFPIFIEPFSSVIILIVIVLMIILITHSTFIITIIIVIHRFIIRWWRSINIHVIIHILEVS